MPPVEQRPTQLSAEWQMHRRQAKRYYGSLRTIWYGLGISIGSLVMSAVGISFVTQTAIGPETLVSILGGSIWSLGLVVTGLFFGYMTINARYLVSPTGFEFRAFSYSVFAPWNEITVVTEPGYEWSLIIGIEFHPPQFEPTWLARVLPWTKPAEQEQVVYSCVCDYRAASRAVLQYARNIESVKSRTSPGGS